MAGRSSHFDEFPSCTARGFPSSIGDSRLAMDGTGWDGHRSKDWNDLLVPLESQIGPWLAAVFVLYIAFAVLAMMNVVTGNLLRYFLHVSGCLWMSLDGFGCFSCSFCFWCCLIFGFQRRQSRNSCSFSGFVERFWDSANGFPLSGIFVESALQSTRADEEKEVRQQLQELFSRLVRSWGSRETAR